MTEKENRDRQPSDKDEPKLEKETVKDLDPKTAGEDVKGGAKGAGCDFTTD